MRARSRLLAALALALWAPGGLAGAENLFDAIALAYQTNPTLLAARADQRALDERYIQAKAQTGPTASFSLRHSLNNSNVKEAGLFSGPTTTFDRATTDTTQLTLNQPLYAGGQYAAVISAAEADVQSGRQGLRQQEATVLNQVITAYADTLLQQNLVSIAEQNVDILRRQVAETQAKVDVKELTLTDRAEARARLVAAEINLTQAREGMSNAIVRYQSAVGQAPGQLDPLPDLPGIPPNLDQALDVADRANPGILAAAYTELASRARVAQAKAADGLQIGLTASVSQEPLAPYLSHQLINSVQGSVVINKPLFTAGAHASGVREAAETDNRDDLRLAEGRRQLIAAIVQAWNDMASQRTELASLREQLDEQGAAFRGARIEERIGLRTTFEVLNEEQEFQSTKVSLAQTYHDEYLTRVDLLQDLGLLQAELLDGDIAPYRPERSLRQRDRMSRLLPWEGLVMALDTIGAPRTASRPPDRDLLGGAPPAEAAAMPSAPQWADLAKLLANVPEPK